MTAMLLRLSMSVRHRRAAWPLRRLSSISAAIAALGTSRVCRSRWKALLLRRRLLHVLRDDLRIRRVPVGHLHELPALDLPDLHEPAALVIARGDLERRHEATQREVRDLLEAGLHVGARDLAVGLGLQRVADGLDVERGDEHAAIVEDRRLHLLRGGLALLLVHLADLV